MEILAGIYLITGVLIILVKSEFLNSKIYLPFKKLFHGTGSAQVIRVGKRVYPGKIVFYKVALNLSKD